MGRLSLGPIRNAWNSRLVLRGRAGADRGPPAAPYVPDSQHTGMQRDLPAWARIAVPRPASRVCSSSARAPRHAPYPGSVSNERGLVLHNWNRLRVLAGLDIVGLHLTGEHTLFGFGLPLFLIVSIALAVSKPWPPPTPTFCIRRARRILLPWLFWAAVLLLARASFTWSQGKPPFAWAEWRMVLYGSRIHLWFLPAIVVAAVAAHCVHRMTQRQSLLVSVIPALVVGTGLISIRPHVALGKPFDQWCFAIPAIGIGYALGRMLSAQEGELAGIRMLLTGSYCAFGVLVGTLVWADPAVAPLALRYAGGFGLLVAALWLPNHEDPLTKHLTPLMLGVYIVHPTVWRVFVRPMLRMTDADAYGWLHVGLTFPLTMALVWVMRRSRLKHVL